MFLQLITEPKHQHHPKNQMQARHESLSVPDCLFCGFCKYVCDVGLQLDDLLRADHKVYGGFTSQVHIEKKLMFSSDHTPSTQI